MKLRFRNNTLRLRVNRSEVSKLAGGAALQERVVFPGGDSFAYILAADAGSAGAVFRDGTIRISAPLKQVTNWADDSGDVGIYFELPADGSVLKIAIEKDLECVDGAEGERDPDAFPRKSC
jgi:hypothetical protein